MDDVAADRVPLGVLEDGRLGRAAVDAQVEHRAAAVQGEAEIALVHREAQRLLAAAVHDTGHAPLTAESARFTGVPGGAGRDGDLGGSGLGHSDGRW